MKPSLNTRCMRPIYLIASLCLPLLGLSLVVAGTRDPLISDPVRPTGLDYRAEGPQGYLEVYSATDEFDDGGVSYYAHSSYAIYTTDGKVFKSVENHISRSDELPEIVALPAGSYIVEARSDRDGYVRVAVVIKAGHRTTINLESGQQATLTRLARLTLGAAKIWE